jgi:hypothetical protein
MGHMARLEGLDVGQGLGGCARAVQAQPHGVRAHYGHVARGTWLQQLAVEGPYLVPGVTGLTARWGHLACIVAGRGLGVSCDGV